MTTAEKCELILKAVLTALSEGHTVTIHITDEDEFNSDRWVAVEAPHRLYLFSSPHGSFDDMIDQLADSLH